LKICLFINLKYLAILDYLEVVFEAPLLLFLFSFLSSSPLFSA